MGVHELVYRNLRQEDPIEDQIDNSDDDIREDLGDEEEAATQ